MPEVSPGEVTKVSDFLEPSEQLAKEATLILLVLSAQAMADFKVHFKVAFSTK